MSAYTKPLPNVDETNAPHWQGAKARELRMQKCYDCGTLRYPPARHCPSCLSDRSAWVALSGKGEVWSHCAFHRPYFKGFEQELPYSVVLVKLDEGPLLYSNLLGVRREAIRIGMRVRAAFEDVTTDVTLIKFKPD